MQWPELDLDKGVWSLPASRTKNGRPHDVPLSQPAIEILQDQARQPGASLSSVKEPDPFKAGQTRRAPSTNDCKRRAWQSTLAAEKKRLYPECVLGVWLNKDANQTNKAKNVLKDAIACLPAIFAQTSEATKR